MRRTSTPHSSLLTGEQSFHPQSVDKPPHGLTPIYFFILEETP